MVGFLLKIPGGGEGNFRRGAGPRGRRMSGVFFWGGGPIFSSGPKRPPRLQERTNRQYNEDDPNGPSIPNKIGSYYGKKVGVHMP